MDRRAIRNIADAQNVIKWNLDQLILATPTGPAREKLTEANIHLISMSRAMQAAEEADK